MGFDFSVLRYWPFILSGFEINILLAVTKKERKTEKEPPGKIADNLLASIEASKDRPLSRLIAALGIRGVGEVSAADLARHFLDLDALSRASADALQQIDGIGPSVAESVADWFSRPFNKQVLKKLKAAGVWPQGGAGSSTASRTPRSRAARSSSPRPGASRSG